jgi:hypothetical protein
MQVARQKITKLTHQHMQFGNITLFPNFYSLSEFNRVAQDREQ